MHGVVGGLERAQADEGKRRLHTSSLKEKSQENGRTIEIDGCQKNVHTKFI